MTTYEEVAAALLNAGYLTDADVEAAAIVLADALVVDDALGAENAAITDEEYQEDVIADAEIWADEDAKDYDLEDEAMEDDVIAIAEDLIEDDKQAIAEAEITIAAAYTDAAAALLAAELIDEANLDSVAVVISDAWVVEDDQA
jgi:hypothetical protein